MQITDLTKIFRPPELDREASLRRGKEKVSDRSRSALTSVDTVEISANARENRLELIKSRVKSGFYATSSVNEDISDKLSGYFDKLSDKS